MISASAGMPLSAGSMPRTLSITSPLIRERSSVTVLREVRGRVDSGIHMGYSIPPNYDSMIAKLCAWDSTRFGGIKRMRRAISEYVILGVKTTLPLHYAIMNNQQFVAGKYPHALSTGRAYPQYRSSATSVTKRPGCRPSRDPSSRERKSLQYLLQLTMYPAAKKD